MKAWPPPLNWASQAPGMALTSANALGAGITMSSLPVATRVGTRNSRSRSQAPSRCHASIAAVCRSHQVGRELCTRGGHNVAEFAVDGLGEIAGKQQGEQSASLLVRRARRVGQLP